MGTTSSSCAHRCNRQVQGRSIWHRSAEARTHVVWQCVYIYTHWCHTTPIIIQSDHIIGVLDVRRATMQINTSILYAYASLTTTHTAMNINQREHRRDIISSSCNDDDDDDDATRGLCKLLIICTNTTHMRLFTHTCAERGQCTRFGMRDSVRGARVLFTVCVRTPGSIQSINSAETAILSALQTIEHYLDTYVYGDAVKCIYMHGQSESWKPAAKHWTTNI